MNTMSIEIQCPDCSKRFRVEDRFAGKRVKCRNCGGAISVPAAELEAEVDDLQELAGEPMAEEFSPPAPPEEVGSGRGGDEELPQGFGAALNAARSRSSNRQFSLAAYPGAAVAHQHLPWLIGLVCFGFTVHLLIQKVGQAAEPQWPTMLLVGIALFLFLVMVAPLSYRGMKRASQMLHFELSSGAGWRTASLFCLPLLLATMLSDSVAGIVCGLLVGVLMLMPLLWATFQLHWVEAVVAWMMSSLFFAGSSAVVGAVVFLTGLGVALSNPPPPEPQPKAIAKTPKVTPPNATQPTAVVINPPAMQPPPVTPPPEVQPEVQNPNATPSIFDIPPGQPTMPPPPTTVPAVEPPPPVQPPVPPTPPEGAVAQVRILPSPIVANAVELPWVGAYQLLLDGDSLLSPAAVSKRSPTAESVELLGADKPTATVTFRKDPAGSDRYIVSAGGDSVVRAVTWPKPGLQLWNVADGKSVKTTDVDAPEATLTPLCFTSADTVLVHRTLGEQHAIQLFNVRTGQKVREQRTPALFENGYAVSPDGRTLAIATKSAAGPQLHLITIATGQTKKLQIPLSPQWPLTPAGVAFSVDSSRIAMTFEQDGNMLAVAWNTGSGVKTQEHVYPAGTLPLPLRKDYKGRGLDWLADGSSWLVFGGIVIDVPSGQSVGVLRVSGVVNQRVVEGKKIYLEAGADAGLRRIVAVELNAEEIAKIRATLTPPKQ